MAPAFRPRVTAVLLALIIPMVFVVSSVMSLGSAFIPMLIAWGFAGRRIAAVETPRAAPAMARRCHPTRCEAGRLFAPRRDSHPGAGSATAGPGSTVGWTHYA